MKKIMIIDDDEKLTGLLQEFLEQYKFKPIIYHNPIKAISMIDKKKPDLIILDIMMPDMDGFQTLREIRENHLVPVIMLTARGEESDRVRGLDYGADDYIIKPFSTKEFLARVRAILRRLRPSLSEITLEFEDVKMDLSTHTVERDGSSIKLGPTEFKLLKHFLEHPKRVFSREQLLDLIYGNNYHIVDRVIDSHIKRLRKKLRQVHPKKSKFDRIQTYYGIGYRWVPKNNKLPSS